MLKSLNDNRAAFGKETEEALAKELKSVVTNAKNTSNAELQKLMTGDTINWSEVTKLLSMKKTDVEASSDDKRAALYEFTQAAEKGMKRADVLNRKMNDKKE